MPSESDESKLVEDLEMQDSSGEEDAPRRYNSDGEVLPPGQLLDDMAVKVLFETPSGFAIFRYNGYKLRHQVALMKEIWADFADPDSAAHEVRLLGFKTFQNKVHAISQSTGVSNELAKMIRNNLQPRQRLAVGNEDYKSIIEKELGIRCVYDSAVAELMWGLKIQMQSLLTPENSDLSNEDYFPMSTGMYCFLKGQKFDVKPDMMVTRCAIELAFLIYGCDRHVNKRRSTLRSVAAHIAKISRINTEGWDFHKIAVALKIICCPEENIAATHPWFSTGHWRKLKSDAPKYKKLFFKGASLLLYDEVHYHCDLRIKAGQELTSLIKLAKNVDVEQPREAAIDQDDLDGKKIYPDIDPAILDEL